MYALYFLLLRYEERKRQNVDESYTVNFWLKTKHELIVFILFMITIYIDHPLSIQYYFITLMELCVVTTLTPPCMHPSINWPWRQLLAQRPLWGSWCSQPHKPAHHQLALPWQQHEQHTNDQISSDEFSFITHQLLQRDGLILKK